MKIARSAGGTARLKRFLKISVLFLVCVVGLSGCPQLLCEFGVTDLCEETYTVTYSANGAEVGMVPVDGAEYLEGDTVSVQGNTGGLGLSGYSFTGWNTAANGDGIAYSGGSVLTMGAANVSLYAAWSEGEEEEEEEEEEYADILADAYEPDGAGRPTKLILGEVQYHTFHRPLVPMRVETPEGTFVKGDEDNYYVELSLDPGERATVVIQTYGDTPTFLALYEPGEGGDGLEYGEGWISETIVNSGQEWFLCPCAPELGYQEETGLAWFPVLVTHLDPFLDRIPNGGTGAYSISAELETD